MKKFKVTFVEEIECEDEEQAYDILLEILNETVKAEDVTAFNFKEIKTKKRLV
jgi:uncharacterized protein YciU (UPF0263 family)